MYGAATLTKNANIDKYRYSGYGIGFDTKSSFSFPSGGFGQNVMIFGVDMVMSDVSCSSGHVNNKKKDNLILVKSPTQGLEHTPTAEKMNSINFTVTRKKFCLRLHHNRANSYLFVHSTKILQI